MGNNIKNEKSTKWRKFRMAITFILSTIVLSFVLISCFMFFAVFFGSESKEEMGVKQFIGDTIVVAKSIRSDTVVSPKAVVVAEEIALEGLVKQEKFAVYTYVITDDITNDVAIIKSIYSNHEQLINMLSYLYPDSAKISIINVSEIIYTRKK